MIVNIVEDSHPALHTVCDMVYPTDDVQEVINDMMDTMVSANGMGIAANQINVLKRIIIVQGVVVINPVITPVGTTKKYQKEGCLSFPDQPRKVKRYSKIKVTGLDAQGMPFSTTARGITAACYQHEVDHLDGISLIDRGHTF